MNWESSWASTCFTSCFNFQEIYFVMCATWCAIWCARCEKYYPVLFCFLPRGTSPGTRVLGYSSSRVLEYPGTRVPGYKMILLSIFTRISSITRACNLITFVTFRRNLNQPNPQSGRANQLNQLNPQKFREFQPHTHTSEQQVRPFTESSS